MSSQLIVSHLIIYCYLLSSLLASIPKQNKTTKQVPFYPLPPLLVIFLAGVIFTSAVARDPTFILLAVGFVSLSLPVHVFMERNYGWTNTTGRDVDVDGDRGEIRRGRGSRSWDGVKGGDGDADGGGSEKEALFSPLLSQVYSDKESY